MNNMLDNNTAKELLEYISNNLITESRWLTPNPMTSVEVVGLLNKIADLRGISQEDNGLEFNNIMDSKTK